MRKKGKSESNIRKGEAGWFFKKLNIFLGTYYRRLETQTQADAHMLVFPAVPHKAQRWRWSRCPSVGEWINRTRSTQTMESSSAIRRKAGQVGSHPLLREP